MKKKSGSNTHHICINFNSFQETVDSFCTIERNKIVFKVTLTLEMNESLKKNYWQLTYFT